MLRVCFFASDKPREHLLADAVGRGVTKHGCQFEVRALGESVDVTGFDVGCVVGVKSRELLRRINREGAHWLMFDKGLSRHKSRGPLAGWEFWRVAVDAQQPTARLTGLMPRDRWDALGVEMKPWRKSGDGIVIAGSSLKYHDFYGLPHPTTYAKELARQLRALTDRPLIYRPKPSWREATEIKKAAFSRLPETLADLLGAAHVLVTHGSNACFEAVVAGVPCIVLGDGVARPLSSRELSAVEAPLMADDQHRLRWAANLAYWQWKLSEFASGEAWDFIGGELHNAI